MARLPSLPNLEIIQGFKGVIDFAVWKGLPYARAWPRFRRAKLTAASIAAATLFGQIVSSYSLLAALAKAFFAEDAADQPRTPRDIFVSALYGKLHEASMSDFLTLLTECRDFLSDLTALLNALDSVGTDELDVNIEDSVLPDGAATAAHQVTQNASLATIASIADALESIDTDALQIRGRDQLFSFKAQYFDRKVNLDTGAGTISLLGATVPADEIWFVTNAVCWNDVTNNPRIDFAIRHLGVNIALRMVRLPGIGTPLLWSGYAPMVNGDQVRAIFDTCVAHDLIYMEVFGIKMTLET